MLQTIYKTLKDILIVGYEMIEVAKLSDLEVGSLKHVEIKDKEILLANVDGTIFAVDDRCGHMNASLSLGTLEGKIVDCALHHARFDVTTGKHLVDGHLGGTVGFVASKTKMGKLMSSVKTHDLKTYAVKVNEDKILLDL